MAKSSRSTKIKLNNARLKNRVFGPVETARTERLSAKLLELASRSRPSKQTSKDIVVESKKEAEEAVTSVPLKDNKDTEDMEVDQIINRHGKVEDRKGPNREEEN